MAYDDGYVPNKSCPCLRCKLKGLMGAVVLMTIGLIILLNSFAWQWGLRTNTYWGVLLIAIGLMLFGQRTASIEGHIQPYGYLPMAGTTQGTMPPPAASAASGNDKPNPGSGADNHG